MLGGLARLLSALRRGRRYDWSAAAMRRGVAADADPGAALLRDAYIAWTDRGLNPKAATYSGTDVRADLREKEVWLLEHKGGLVGTVTLRTWGTGGARYLYVTHLATPTALHDRGLGSELMRRVEELARERGILDLRLDTATAMTDLIAFYEKRGYAAFDALEHWPGTNYDSQRYRKVLTSVGG